MFRLLGALRGPKQTTAEGLGGHKDQNCSETGLRFSGNVFHWLTAGKFAAGGLASEASCRLQRASFTLRINLVLRLRERPKRPDSEYRFSTASCPIWYRYWSDRLLGRVDTADSLSAKPKQSSR